jgi:site-specific DNA-cytosine methylase
MNGLALCAGVEGLGIGLQIAVPEYRTICMVEREAYAAAVVAEKMEAGVLAPCPIWDDLYTFDGKPWRGLVDIVSAGLPCQPFSVAGTRKGDEDERYIWPEFFRIVREVSAPLVFIENVSAFTSWFRPIGEELCDLGYELEVGLFSAAEVGAPHKRERFFCLAFMADAGLSIVRQPAKREPESASNDNRRSEELQLAHTDIGSAGWTSRIRKSGEGRKGHQVRGGTLEHTARDSEPRQEREGGRRGWGVCETGDSVAHSNRSEHQGWSIRPREEGSRGPHGGSGRSGDDLECEFCGYRFPSQCGRYGCPDCLADTGSERPQGESSGGAAQGAIGRGCGDEMADTDCSRRPPDWDAGGGGWERQPFPPGPGDREAWDLILRERPELAPALADTKNVRWQRGNGRNDAPEPRRVASQLGDSGDGQRKEETQPAVRNVADGPPNRVDQLRACGNGVVPIQAAFAFSVLARKVGLR